MSNYAEDYGYDGYDIYYIIEQYEERIKSLEKEKFRRQRGIAPNGEVWETEDGTLMLMWKMTDRHIDNAIKYFQRLIDETYEVLND